jgi:hypothetical protein
MQFLAQPGQGRDIVALPPERVATRDFRPSLSSHHDVGHIDVVAPQVDAQPASFAAAGTEQLHFSEPITLNSA